VGWVVEGPGDLHLYRTRDGGSTWELRGNIPKPHWIAMLRDLRFDDHENGQVVLELPCESLLRNNSRGDALVVLRTNDAGGHWKERARFCMTGSPAWHTSGIDEGNDLYRGDTSWRVEDSRDDEVIRLLKHDAGNEGNDVVASLPNTWRRQEDGTMQPCRSTIGQAP
jgi:hypothetical protein